MTVAPILTGVDLVDVVRLRVMVDESGPEFLHLGWSVDELEYCQDDTARLAARWAAKEATMKALGRGIGQLSPLEIEVRNDELGAPALLLSGGALERAEELNVYYWSLALSHEGGFAVAFVVAMAGGKNVEG